MRFNLLHGEQLSELFDYKIYGEDTDSFSLLRGELLLEQNNKYDALDGKQRRFQSPSRRADIGIFTEPVKEGKTFSIQSPSRRAVS